MGDVNVRYMLFDVGWHETAYPVTHWMLLPEPPKEEDYEDH